MKIIHIKNTKTVLKTKQELNKELSKCENHYQKILVNEYKEVPLKEPTYIIEISPKEFQLVSFYLELENRKPITNIELKPEIQYNKSRDSKGRFIKR